VKPTRIGAAVARRLPAEASARRRTIVLGVAGLALAATLAACALVLSSGAFSSGYEISVSLPSASGLSPGAKVYVSGVPVGHVESLHLSGNRVVARLFVSSGTLLPADTHAAVTIDSLLGMTGVELSPGNDWSHTLKHGARIVSNDVPVQLYQLQDVAGHVVEGIDVNALNTLTKELESITDGNQAQVRALIGSLASLLSTLSAHASQLSSLIDASAQVVQAAEGSRQQLSGAIRNLAAVIGTVASEAAQLSSLISSTAQAASATNSLLADSQPQLNDLVSRLQTLTGVVARHQLDLASLLADLASGFRNVSQVTFSGSTPVPWQNIFIDFLYPTGVYGVFGPCGALAQAETELLGPDPLGCNSSLSFPASSSGTSALSQIVGVAGGQAR
jgi:phospholipid/cholesterol/gamma-HCH transport system substrate-binding protein